MKAVHRFTYVAVVAVAATLLATPFWVESRRHFAAPGGLPIKAEHGQLQALYANCMTAMINDVCTVRNERTPTPEPTAGLTFVAGLGAIDSESYRRLRESGDAMCSLTKDVCEQDWDGPQCRLGRSLWSSAAVSR